MQDRYRTASPWPHLVVDGVVSPESCRAVVDAVATIDVASQDRQETRRIRKISVSDPVAMGPVARGLVEEFNDEAVIADVAALTGIEGLCADPSLAFAGVYVTPPGGWHRLHSDFSRHPATGLWNRAAVLLYLSDWQPGDGGELELWETGGRAPTAVIEPLAGRMVVFEANAHALHAIRAVSATAPPRVAIGVRYYSAQAPAVPPLPLYRQTVRRPGERRIDVLPTAAEVVAMAARMRAIRQAHVVA